MIKLFTIIFFSLIFNTKLVFASGWYEEYMYKSNSTTYQDLSYLQKNLVKYLNPLKYELIPESINIEDQIFMPGLGSPVKIVGADLAIRIVYFRATNKNDQKVYTGFIYFACARDTNIQLNSSSEEMKSYSQLSPKNFRLALVDDFKTNSFLLEISEKSLHLDIETTYGTLKN